MDSTYKVLLASKQKLLSAEFAFPFLEHRWAVSILTATRTYSFPTTTTEGATYSIDLERDQRAYISWSNKWIEVDYGISEDDYNLVNPDLDSRLDPVRRWRYLDQSTFEVWPKPASAQTFRFVGQRALLALVANGDVADLDDELLTLSVAEDLLMKRQDASSQVLLSYAQQRLRTLKAHYPTYDRVHVMGGQRSVPISKKRVLLA